MIAKDNLLSNLRDRFPEFENQIDEHLELYEELLSHVLFGDFTRYLIYEYRRGNLEVVMQVAYFIEEMLTSKDTYIDELAHVSFLENLHQAGDNYPGIVKMLGSEAQRRMRLIEPTLYCNTKAKMT